MTEIRNVWLLVCTALVFFMQAGFCCLEAGSVRPKNNINVALKNVIDFLVAGMCFYLVGYSLMWGNAWLGNVVGHPAFMMRAMRDEEAYGFLFQMVFCGTAATIVSGAMAERLRFMPYILGSAGLSILIYPLFGYWVWNTDGFLNRMGFHDFAGSSVVHMVGGTVALAGIQTVGARIGRFDAKGRPREYPGADLPLVALGTFILFFGWIGFNGGSSPFGPHTGMIVVNTVMGGISGGMICLLAGWALQGISGAASVMNGILAGLVAITASADVVTPAAAVLIGSVGGLCYYFGDRLLLKARLDDVVGAVPVHMGAGLAGVLLTAVFAKQSLLDDTARRLGTEFTRGNLFQAQLIGAVVCLVWTYLAGLLLWVLIGKLTRLRVTEAEERVGLNYSEHHIGNPVDEIVSYLQARSDDPAGAARPFDLEGGQYGRLLASVEAWADRLEREREEIGRIRGFLDNDSGRLNDLIHRCHEQNRAQAQRLESVTERVSRVGADLRGRALQGAAPSPLAADVLESVSEKLSEMRAAAEEMAYQWEQLRNLGNSLLLNMRPATGPRGAP